MVLVHVTTITLQIKLSSKRPNDVLRIIQIIKRTVE